MCEGGWLQMCTNDVEKWQACKTEIIVNISRSLSGKNPGDKIHAIE